ncbi:MAG: hypothetical protein LBS74_11645 [Oscillospiraceae bacterium]|jgi:penicillin-binding protein 2|nr:hypothetical protein [Oscillospiraceae bacterium]
MENTMKISRYIIIILLVAGVCFYYIMTLMNLQIEENAQYEAKAKTTNVRTITIAPARGEIVDRYGSPLAENRMGYSIILDKNYLVTGSENKILTTLANMLNEGETWVNNMPLIIDDAGKATFPADSESKIKKMKEKLKLQAYATAQDCLDEMMEKWKLGNIVTAEAKLCMTARYGMLASDFSASNPYTFAEDVSIETVQKVKENAVLLPGVNVNVVPYREYLSGDIAPHLIGNVGPIFAEEYADLKTKGYGMNDKLGKSGIEKEMESYLRGTSGKREITRDSKGNIIDTIDTQAAIAGNTIVLTLDTGLQKVAQESLGKTVRQIARDGKASGVKKNGEDANAGAAVVIDVRNGEVLAAASYPYYRLEDYNKEYDTLVKTDGNPLFNRVLYGTYAPGSTFKPAMAISGLQEGEISSDSLITCNRVYVKDNFRLKCLGAHGSLNVTSALAYSCNIFFYETGYRLGIARMNDYCRQLGLGVPSGIGLGESKGTLAGREQRLKQHKAWYIADTLTAAIGQNDNRFTPMQMASYIMTMANGGKRYSATLVKTIKSYGFDKTIVPDTASQPTLLNTMNLNEANIAIVRQGMLEVTREGTAREVFGSYPIDIAGKTGTSMGAGSDTALFIAYAPLKNPQIALVIVGEHCLHGSSMAPVAKDIFDKYFFGTRTEGDPVLTGTGLMP